MNDVMIQMLQGVTRLYPHKLEEHYPRIFTKIIELWDTPQIDSCFHELMMNSRPGRQGFPVEVANEIFYLSQVRERTRDTAAPASADIWANIELVKLRVIETHGYECSPQGFLKSAESGNRDVISAFLSSGANVDICDERGWTPLMISSFNGNAEIARLLINRGANIHIKDKSGYSPIHWAAFNGYNDVVKLLIAKQVDLNARSTHGWTALLQAATRGHESTCSELIASGVDVNQSSNDGWTPLHKACANGHIGVVKLLLAANASRNVRHQDGSTPLSLAIKNKHAAIEALL